MLIDDEQCQLINGTDKKKCPDEGCDRHFTAAEQESGPGMSEASKQSLADS